MPALVTEPPPQIFEVTEMFPGPENVSGLPPVEIPPVRVNVPLANAELIVAPSLPIVITPA